MPRTADKTDIPRRLATAGYELFKQNGYNATGIQQITERAGVPKGSFYNHFDSKEAFAHQIIRDYAAWMERQWALCLADAPADPLDAIRHVFGKFIAHHEQSSCPGCLVGNFAAEMTESSPLCRDELSRVMRMWQVNLAGLIQRAQDAGRVRRDLDALTLSAFFWDTWEGALLRMKVEHDSRPLQDALALLLDKFLRA